MSKTVKKSWISLYIYYNPPFNSLLLNISLLIKKLKKDGLLEKYFFIRYWENGFHIRLRLLVKPENRVKSIQISKKIINNFLKKNPSEYPSSWKYPEFQNNIKLRKYEPELDRYGGGECIDISESQFHLSSEVVFKILGEYGELSYEHSFYSALKYHILLLKIFELSQKDAHVLLNYYTDLWVNSILNKYHGYDSIENIMKKFDALYSTQKSGFDEMIKTIKSEYEEKDKLSEYWNKNINKIYRQLKKADELNIDVKYVYDKSASGKHHLYNLLPSYIHMMNNRLGIPNHDEAFISYVIKKYINKFYTNEQ